MKIRIFFTMVIVALSLGGCRIFSSTYSQKESFFDPENIELPDIFEIYSASKDVAENWRPNSYATSFSLDIAFSSEFITFTFGSPSDSEWMNIYPIKNKSGYQFETETGNFPKNRDLSAIDLVSIPTSIEEIYQTAYTAVNGEIQATDHQIVRSLIKLDQINDLSWWVTFILEDETFVISVAIDPYTGEVTEIRRSLGFEGK